MPGTRLSAQRLSPTSLAYALDDFGSHQGFEMSRHRPRPCGSISTRSDLIEGTWFLPASLVFRGCGWAGSEASGPGLSWVGEGALAGGQGRTEG